MSRGLDLKLIKKRLLSHQPLALQAESKQRAAVTMLLRNRDQNTEVLFIRRAEHDQDPWSGDLGFPGGRIDTADSSPRDAAEREALEEVGINLIDANYLGQNDDLAGAYLSIHISCFVYQVDNQAQFKLNGEIVDLFWVGLDTLLEPQRNQQLTFFYRGRDRTHPAINLKEWSERPLWGITYRLLENFLHLFDRSFTYRERQ